MSFPGATKTFTVKRPGQTTIVGNNLTKAPNLTVLTGVSILLTSKQAYIDTFKTGEQALSIYLGTCSKRNNILMGDLLLDETTNDSNGIPITYMVEDVNPTQLYLEMYLRKTQLP
jgi:hypothetical protein